MGRNDVDPELREEIAAIAEEAGCELLDVEHAQGTLRLILDTPQGDGRVTIDDCTNVSRQVSALLDVSDFGTGRYTLEVSSPGLDRQLYGPRDYRRFTGRAVRVTYEDPETRHKRTVSGQLAAFDEEAPGGAITVAGTESGETLHIPLGDVRVARLEIEI